MGSWPTATSCATLAGVPMPPLPTIAELAAAADRLGVQLEGEPFATRACLLCWARYRGEPAVLKVSHEPEEIAGAAALQWWDGDGAVRVLVRDGDATVLERAGASLRQAVANDDASSTSILCEVIARLHRRGCPEGGFAPLRQWMRALLADAHPRFERARHYAEQLLSADHEPTLLHGDVHSENVLLGRGDEWLAIDPKGLIGPRAFDYCNLFTNWTLDESIAHFDARLAQVAQRARLERDELLRWIVAWSALSGLWYLDDGGAAEAAYPHAVMELALARLARRG